MTKYSVNVAMQFWLWRKQVSDPGGVETETVEITRYVIDVDAIHKLC